MEVIKYKRGGGKTYELIKMAIENNYCLVCHDNATKIILKSENPNPEVITFEECSQGAISVRGKRINGFVVDNIDLCMKNVKTISVIGKLDSSQLFIDKIREMNQEKEGSLIIDK